MSEDNFHLFAFQQVFEGRNDIAEAMMYAVNHHQILLSIMMTYYTPVIVDTQIVYSEMFYCAIE